MTDRLKIALAQMNQRVGDLDGNAAAMLEMRRRAHGADLLLCPELQLVGYPPEDLVLKPEFVRRVHECTDALVAATVEPGPAMLIGTITHEGGLNYNTIVVADGGRVIGRTFKHELPNYGTFDEKRVFAAGPLPEPIEWRGVKLGVPICEDMWLEPVCAHLAELGAEFFLVPHGSPYELDKIDTRERLARSRTTSTQRALAFLNRVGGQDELVFDGSSFVMHPDGEVVVQMPDWDEALLVTDWSRTPDGWRCTTRESHTLDAFPEDIYKAMMVGLHDYVQRNGFPGVILGLSGGIDSALSAAIAVDALGADKVWCVMLPSKYTSEESLEDASECARLLGCRHDAVSIAPGVDGIEAMLPQLTGLAAENVQARLRMVALMALSNSGGQMLLTTGNKSEMSVGYATLYGDMAGGFAVIKDVPKTMVYELAERRNRGQTAVIPKRILDRPPTAELRPDQKDEDSLPPYPVLDPILKAYVEEDRSVEEMVEMGFDRQTVLRVVGLVDRSEYKRRQAPVGIKITHRGLGKDRRMPITNKYRGL